MGLRYDAILVDADETIFDFQMSESYALGATFADFGLPHQVETFIDLFRAINASVWREYEEGRSTPQEIRTRRFVLLAEKLNLDTNPQNMSDRYVGHLAEASFLLEGAEGLLEQLRGTAPLLLVTNGLSAVQRSRFARAGMDRYFDDVLISEEIGVQKPNPEVFRLALERAGAVKAANGDGVPVAGHLAIMLGDNLHSDIKGALDAGLDACWVNLRGRENPDGISPTFTVTSLSEIPALLGL